MQPWRQLLPQLPLPCGPTGVLARRLMLVSLCPDAALCSCASAPSCWPEYAEDMQLLACAAGNHNINRAAEEDLIAEIQFASDDAGSSGTGQGQGAAGQQHSQPVPINDGSSAKSAAHKMLNGNAATFHPSSGTPNGRSMAESPTGPGMQAPAQPKNGVISYRNAAGDPSQLASYVRVTQWEAVHPMP